MHLLCMQARAGKGGSVVSVTKYCTTSPEETEAIGEKLGASLTGTEVIAFVGGLGMGKNGIHTRTCPRTGQ